MRLDCDTAPLFPAPAPKRAHWDCGVFVENVPLLQKMSDRHAGEVWVPRREVLLRRDLATGYGHDLDIQGLMPHLAVIAAAMNKGNVSAACAKIASLSLPAFPSRVAGRLNAGAQRQLAGELKKGGVIIPRQSGQDFDSKHPRYPKHSPGGVGGEFSPKDGSPFAATIQSLRAHLTSIFQGGLALVTARGTLKNVLRGLMGLAMSIGSARKEIIHGLFESLAPSLWRDVEGGAAHVLAAKDFAGGKTLEEITEHPGGPGYQLHHFLEDTAENRANLPPGYRDLPEQKGYIPTFAHEDVHAALSGKDVNALAGTVRDRLRSLSPERQRAEMLDIMRQKGILK